MPTYEYACKSCGEHLEVVQSFTDDALTECPACAGPLRKVFGNIGIAFKGSGFYKNDSRSSSKSTGSTKPAAGGESTTSSESSTSSDSSGTGTAAKETTSSGSKDSTPSSPSPSSGSPAAVAS